MNKCNCNNRCACLPQNRKGTTKHKLCMEMMDNISFCLASCENLVNNKNKKGK